MEKKPLPVIPMQAPVSIESLQALSGGNGFQLEVEIPITIELSDSNISIRDGVVTLSTRVQARIKVQPDGFLPKEGKAIVRNLEDSIKVVETMR